MKGSKSIFILISNRNYSNDQCKFDATLSNYGIPDTKFDDTNKFICALNYNEVFGYDDITNSFNNDTDIVFIRDYEFSVNIRSKLASIISGSDHIYCIYHKTTLETDPKTGKKQKADIKNICSQKILYEISQSHIPESIYCDELRDLLKWRKEKNEEKYRETLKVLKKRFPDPFLENNLVLLHNLLTPKGFEGNEERITELLADYNLGFDLIKLKTLDYNTYEYQEFLSRLSAHLLN